MEKKELHKVLTNLPELNTGEDQTSISASIFETERMLDNVQNEKSPFSDKAFNSLKKEIRNYIADLISESLRIARRNKSDNIDSAHVEQASAHLVSKKRSKINFMIGTFGGIMLGATLSNYLDHFVFNQPSTPNALIASSVVGMIGVMLLTISILRD